MWHTPPPVTLDPDAVAQPTREKTVVVPLAVILVVLGVTMVGY